MKLQHVRHATSILTYAGIQILIDPILADQESYPAIPMTPNRRRNPMVGLKTPMDAILDTRLLLLTHTHSDHFDSRAIELLDKKLPVICPCQDEQKLKANGFLQVHPVTDTLTYENITFIRVDAKHGTGCTGKVMGPASGYILKADTEPTVYITGDTVYYPEVKKNILNYQPQLLIMNAGSPKFLYSNRIVMNIMDIEKTLKVNPRLAFVIVHLDTFNHCIETRADLHEYFTRSRLEELHVKNFYIPEDNELLDESCFPLK